MKQEHAQIIQYLPHGLKGVLSIDETDSYASADWFEPKLFEKGAIWQLCGYAEEDLSIPLGEGEFEGLLWRSGSTYVNFGKELKPLLHPLSKLGENSYIDELWFEVIATDSDSFDKGDFYETCELGLVQLLPFMVVQRLFKDHIDVFGLIPKGLAEAIKTEKA